MLKKVGVELSSYHGGSLNRKDVKKVMNNASHIFDQFAAIFKEGRGRIACYQMTILIYCVFIFGRFMFCGMEHFH